MRLSVALSENVAGFLEGELSELAKDVREAVNAAAEGLRDELRNQVRAAGLGAGLEKAWRAEVYPKGRSRTLRPAGLVYSKATVLHQAYIAGPVIVAGKGYLTIALPAAVAMGFGYSADLPRGNRGIPAGAKRKYSQLGAAIAKLGEANLKMVPGKKPGTVVVLYVKPGGSRKKTQQQRPVPLFVLVRSTKVKKALDLDGPAEKWLNAMYARLAALG